MRASIIYFTVSLVVVISLAVISGCVPIPPRDPLSLASSTAAPPAVTAAEDALATIDWLDPHFDGCETATVSSKPAAIPTPAPLTGVLHEVQRTFERYGIPPGGGAYQPITRTFDIWYDAPSSLNHRSVVTLTLASGESLLSQVSASDGESWLFYDRETDADHAYQAPASYRKAYGDADRMRQGLSKLMVKNLERVGADDEWCYLGRQDLPGWGLTYVVAREWHCTPARGCPTGEWYAEVYWMQPELGRIPLRVELRTPVGGRQELSRRDEILSYEVIPLKDVDATVFRYAFPPDLSVVKRDALYDPNNPAAHEPKTLSMEEYAAFTLYTPIMPARIPAPYKFARIEHRTEQSVTLGYINPDDPIYRFPIELSLPGGCVDSNNNPLRMIEKDGIRLVWLDEASVCAEFPAIPGAPTAWIRTILLTQQEIETVLASMRSIQ